MHVRIWLLLAAALPLWAQQPGIEVQVHMDTSGSVLEISPALRNKTGLFPEMDHFVTAQLFQQNDSLFILELAYRQEGVLARKRSVLDRLAAMEFRRDLSRRLAILTGGAAMNQEGRPGLIVRQTLMGLGFYGWSVPTMLHVKGGRESVATYMLVGSASFALPYYLTQNRPVSRTQSMLTFYGSTRGILYGALIKNIVAHRIESPEGDFGPPLAGSILGSFAAFHLAGQRKWDIGHAELVGVMGDFGTGLGLGTAHVAGLWDYESRKPMAHAVTVTMTGMGFAAGSWLSQREHYTRGDAYVLRMEGLLGAQIMMPIAAALGDRKDKAYTTGAILGGTLGIGIGNRLLHGQDFDDAQGALISCGHIAGGLLAGGITYLADTHDRFDSLVYHSTIALGSLAGHFLLYHTFKARD